MKYIIVNCPALITDNKNHLQCFEKGIECRNIINCLLKRIVQNCCQNSTGVSEKGVNIRPVLAGKAIQAKTVLEYFELRKD